MPCGRQAKQAGLVTIHGAPGYRLESYEYLLYNYSSTPDFVPEVTMGYVGLCLVGDPVGGLQSSPSEHWVPVDEQDGGHDLALEQGQSTEPRRKTQALVSRPTTGTASLLSTRNAGLAALRLKAGCKVPSGGKMAFASRIFRFDSYHEVPCLSVIHHVAARLLVRVLSPPTP